MSRRLHLRSASLPSLGPDNTAVATQFMIKIVAQNCRPKLSSPPMAQKALGALPKINAGQFPFWKIIADVSPINENCRQNCHQNCHPGCRKPRKRRAIGRWRAPGGQDNFRKQSRDNVHFLKTIARQFSILKTIADTMFIFEHNRPLYVYSLKLSPKLSPKIVVRPG